MTQLDIASQPRIARVNTLLRTVSGLDDPQEVQLEFSKGLRDGSGALVDAYLSVSRRDLKEGEYKITRMPLPDNESDTQQNPWRDWEKLETHSGGFIGEMIQTPEPKLFSRIHLGGDPVLSDWFSRFGSLMVVPLFDSGEALNWSFMFAERDDAFDEEILERYMMRGNLIGRVTRNLIVKRDVDRLNAKLQNQLDEISSIQRSLLPKSLPDVPGLSLASSYLTSNDAGGDFYDVFPVGDGRWVLMIADVSGHGAGAATVVAMMSSIIRGYPQLVEGPSSVFRHLNGQLVNRRIESNFVTAFICFWHPETGEIEYANAGHHPPLIRDPDGNVHALEGEHDIPLGILHEAAYPNNLATLTDGQTVVLFTDGITEAFSPMPENEMFGTERLAESLVTCSGEPQCIIGHIHDALFAHTTLRTRDDDQTILTFRVKR